ncbi:hypothetical protein, partial [Escherichia coli]
GVFYRLGPEERGCAVEALDCSDWRDD